MTQGETPPGRHGITRHGRSNRCGKRVSAACARYKDIYHNYTVKAYCLSIGKLYLTAIIILYLALSEKAFPG